MNLPCPACGRMLECPDPAPETAQCPYCDRVFDASHVGDEPEQEWAPTPYARSAVKWPGFALAAVGIFGILMALMLIVVVGIMLIWVKSGGTLPKMYEDLLKPEEIDQLTDPEVLMSRLTLSIAMLVDSIILLIGAVNMLMLTSLRWAFAGIICSMMPCLQFLFFVSLPIGIWALIVVNRPGVWRAFRSHSNRRVPHA